MRIEVPEKVSKIIHVLLEHGYEAYAVGGCVRDSLIFREVNDWDITTSASPQQVKALFRRTIDTGIQHGTVTVMLEKEGFEVTTYRIDGEYEDGRHPKEVTFTSNLEEDLKYIKDNYISITTKNLIQYKEENIPFGLSLHIAFGRNSAVISTIRVATMVSMARIPPTDDVI